MSLNHYELVTFHDAVEHVLDQVVGGDGSPRNRRQAVRAIQEAYSELPRRRNWRYFYRRLKVTTSPSQNTGTVTYDHTGGSQERLVTLSGATWPAEAQKYELLINHIRYEIDSRLSDTELTLGERANPGEDLAASGYTLMRDTYELPADVRGLDYLYDTLAPGRMLPQVSPNSILRESRLVKTTAVPTMYSVTRSYEYAGALALIFAPAPQRARTYDAIVQTLPLPLTTVEESTGTVTTALGNTQVDGQGTAFGQQHVGAVIRFSADGQVPTGLAGQIHNNAVHPYVLQGVVRRVESGTRLFLEQPADRPLEAVGFRLSSRIDIEAGSMRSALLKLCEARFAAQDRAGYRERMADYEREYELAAYADMRMQESPGHGYLPHNLADVAASVTPR